MGWRPTGTAASIMKAPAPEIAQKTMNMVKFILPAMPAPANIIKNADYCDVIPAI
jgi:hypothetical protein